MKTYLLFILALSGCAQIEADKDLEAFNQANRNFVYQTDIANEYRVYGRIDKRFYGDCEDFALTLREQIGGEVFALANDRGEWHAVLVKKGVVYDFSHRPTPFTAYLKNYKYSFRGVIRFSSADMLR